MRSLLLALAGVLVVASPAHATPTATQTDALTLCPSADTTAVFCVFDIPRVPDAPTFFIRRSGVRVSISPARAARKLERWGYVLEDGFWRYEWR